MLNNYYTTMIPYCYITVLLYYFIIILLYDCITAIEVQVCGETMITGRLGILNIAIPGHCLAWLFVYMVDCIALSPKKDPLEAL